MSGWENEFLFILFSNSIVDLTFLSVHIFYCTLSLMINIYWLSIDQIERWVYISKGELLKRCVVDLQKTISYASRSQSRKPTVRNLCRDKNAENPSSKASYTITKQNYVTGFTRLIHV